MRPEWITLHTINGNTMKPEGEIEALISEICLLQQFEEKQNTVVPSVTLETSDGPQVTPAQVAKDGHPEFTAVSMKSGLQFRATERKVDIKAMMAGPVLDYRERLNPRLAACATGLGCCGKPDNCTNPPCPDPVEQGAVNDGQGTGAGRSY